MPRTTDAVKRGQPIGSSMRTRSKSATGGAPGEPSTRAVAGSSKRSIAGRVRRAEQRVHFAGDAHHRHAVRPVGGDVDVEDGFVQKVLERLTDRRVGLEDVDAVFVGRDVQLVAGADHALGA